MDEEQQLGVVKPPRKKRILPNGQSNRGKSTGQSSRLGKEKAEILNAFNPDPGSFHSLLEISAEDYQQLASQVKDREEKAAKEIYWAGRNRFVHPSDIDPKTVPSRMSVTWLELAQRDPGKFADHVSKLLPSRQQLDIQERFQDDGRATLELLAAAQQQYESESAERSGREHPVPPLDSEAGGGELGREEGNLDRLRA